MSARVLNPIMLTEFYTMRSPSAVRCNVAASRKLNRIKKDLFGPTDSSENKRSFNDELGRHQDVACKKWGFDFRSGYPLTGHGQFIWERVTFGDFIPEMYTLSRAAHVREAATFESTEADLLLDERAARQNSPSSNGGKTFVQDIVEDAVLFKVPVDERLAACSSAGKRQPKITEYMKERKRHAPTPKKLSPVKRLRTNLHSSSIGGSYVHRSKMP